MTLSKSDTLSARFSIWNLRRPPPFNPFLTAAYDPVTQRLSPSFCHWCQCPGEDGICRRCDSIQLTRELVAEGFSMFVLMFVGTAVTAQYLLTSGVDGSAVGQAFAWGIATAFAIYLAGGVSGAHLNPALTVTLAILGRFPWRRVLPYILVQFLATFLAGLLVFFEYHDLILSFENSTATGVRDPQKTGPSGELSQKTAYIFLVAPASYLSFSNFVFDQFIGTAMQTVGFAAIHDIRNTSSHPTTILAPLLTGAWITVSLLAFGVNTEWSFNPARNYGMQLAAFVLGYGDWLFYSWEWTYLLFPMLGGLAGYVAYDFLVAIHHTPIMPHTWTAECEVAAKKKKFEAAERMQQQQQQMLRVNGGGVYHLPPAVEHAAIGINSSYNTAVTPLPSTLSPSSSSGSHSPTRSLSRSTSSNALSISQSSASNACPSESETENSLPLRHLSSQSLQQRISTSPPSPSNALKTPLLKENGKTRQQRGSSSSSQNAEVLLYDSDSYGELTKSASKT